MQSGKFETWNLVRFYRGSFMSRLAILVALVFLFVSDAELTAQAASSPATVGTIHVDATPGHSINSFDPDGALGSSIDVLSRDGIDKVYTPHYSGIALRGVGTDHVSQQLRVAHGRLALE